jgi:hypothetical protein
MPSSKATQQEITCDGKEQKQRDQGCCTLQDGHKAPAAPDSSLGLGWGGNGKDPGQRNGGEFTRPLNRSLECVQIPLTGLARRQVTFDSILFLWRKLAVQVG